MVSHNVDVHACAIKRSKIRSHDDAFRILKSNKRDLSTSADDLNICTWQPAAIILYPAAAL